MEKINKALILAIGIVLFVISYSIDKQTIMLFKGFKFAFLDFVLGIITNFGIVVVVMLLTPLLVLHKKKLKLAYLLLLTFAASFVLAFIIKLIVLRQRPIEVFAYPFISIIDYSFPSIHSTVAFSLLPLLVKHLPKQKSFWIAFAFLVAFSRVYFRFHFLSDVVFGAFAGFFIGRYLLELYERGKLWKKKAK